jgi:hypothetical protein
VGLFCTAITVHAQNNTSPYSIIGIGDLEKSTFDRTTGMGHAGIGLSSNRFFYQSNPASYSSLDEHFFYFEFATRFKSVTYSGSPITDITNNQSTDLQFKKLALALKIKPRWAVSFGLLPFSSVNYSFNGKKTIQGSNLFTDANYLGTGSTNLAYIANSFTVSKNFSIGLQTSYLFGQIDETESLSTQLTDSAIVTNRNISIGNPLVKLGLQYKAKLSSKWGIALGATASTKTKLRANYSLLAKSGNSVLIDNQYYKSNYFTLPVTYTGGIAANYKNAYTFALDYNYQGWKQLNYSGVSYTLENSQRISGGFEYSKKGSYLNQTYEKYFLQTGLFYSNSYLRISGQQLKDYGITFGAGAELSRTALSGLALQGALEIGNRGTTTNGLIKEAYTQFNVTISYRDFWFSRKMKKYE